MLPSMMIAVLRPEHVASVVLYGPSRALGQDGPPVHCRHLDFDRDNRSATGRVFHSDALRAGENPPIADR